MKNGIPCNDYYHTLKAKKNRIEFRFVSDDGNTPSACTVKIGDRDPLTGEPVTDLDFFTEYYRLADHQIYVQNKETKGLLYMDGIYDDEGDEKAEKKSEFSIPAADPFGENEPEEILRLRELAESLNERQKDIYEALLIKYAGGKEQITMTELARKWNVSITRICQERDQIIQKIKKHILL